MVYFECCVQCVRLGQFGEKAVVFPCYVIESERNLFPLTLTERTCQKHHYNITAHHCFTAALLDEDSFKEYLENKTADLQAALHLHRHNCTHQPGNCTESEDIGKNIRVRTLDNGADFMTSRDY